MGRLRSTLGMLRLVEALAGCVLARALRHQTMTECWRWIWLSFDNGAIENEKTKKTPLYSRVICTRDQWMMSLVSNDLN